MTWLTLRQHRTELLILTGVIAALGILLLVTGFTMRQDFQQLGVGACLANPLARPDCGALVGAFEDNYRSLQDGALWLNLLPALYGVLLGVPLAARDYEQRTNLLAWTQSVSQRRWLWSKIGILVGASIVLAVISIASFTWWNWAFDQIDGHFAETSFDFEGITPIGYAVFSLALGIAAGAILRRAIPAIAVAVIAFVPFRLWVEFWLRQRYMAPLTTALDSSAITRFDWRLAEQWVDSSGHQLSDYTVFSTCDTGTSKADVFQCFAAHGWNDIVTYQPASRFWAFQGIETAIFLALAAALLGLTIWWVGYRAR